VSLGRWGRTRKFLITDNDYLKGYRVFIGTNDYGKQLSVSWYLTLETNILTQMSAAAAKNFFYAIIFFPILLVAKLFNLKFYTIPERMDLFDQEELRAYITTVHETVKTATEGLMKSLDLDFSKVDTKSRGFFNIS
jgi:competence CoiA-like predicted nuclease